MHLSYRGINLWALLLIVGWCAAARAEDRPPNFIVIFCDNLGYGDIGCFGSKLHRTPHVDRMARQGIKLTSFYATSGVCTPSRSSIITGCYAQRVNMHVSDKGGAVLQPVSPKGLNPDEITIAEVLKGAGYATSIIGKWHLGDQLPFLPTRQGFDEYFGIPYSDDMTQREGQIWPPLPLMRGEKVIEAPVDRDLLTKRYTEEAIDFITRHQDKPFFLYLPHAMPGSTQTPYSSEAFRGKSANGLWGDSVEEIDWSTGQILDCLKQLGLDEQTLVVWTSDNGAPRRTPPQGLNRPLVGWGYDTSEGGMRVPCVVRWPGKIPAGIESDEVCSTMDLLPTFAKLAGTTAPADRKIDGHDIWPLLSGQADAKSPYEAFFYYNRAQLHAVRSGPYKLYLPLAEKHGRGRGKPELNTPALLYNLQEDLQETKNLAESKPGIVARMLAYAEMARADLGDHDRPGAGQRPAGLVENPDARVMAD